MVTLERASYQSASRNNEFYGKSTDTKPTKNVSNGDIFYEMDTSTVYMYDEQTSTWLEQ